MSVKVTVLEVARQAGVSSATVDRVLNDRSGVKEHTRTHVMAVAARLGYLSGRPPGPDFRLAFLLPQGTNSFIRLLQAQIEQQARALQGFATQVETIEGFNPAVLSHRLSEMRGQIDGLGVVALDHPVVREALRRLAASGIKIVTLCSDIQNVPRIAYIGPDNQQAGRLAGYVMGRFLGKGAAKVALFAGSLSYRGHQEREMGFRQVLHEEFPQIELVEVREMMDDRESAFRETIGLLQRHPDLAGIYNVGGGSFGIGRALKNANLSDRIVLIGHEATPGNKAMILEGTMDAAIDQNPRVEARECLAVLSAALSNRDYRPPPMRQHIIFRENLPEE